MKTSMKILSVILLAAMTITFVSCANAPEMGREPYFPNFSYKDEEIMAPDDASIAVAPDGTPIFRENDFISTNTRNISTFSADVDTASYTYFRKLTQMGHSFGELKYQNSAFRTEEFINYFYYNVSAPENGELFGVTTRIMPCPWNDENLLLRLSLRTEEAIERKDNNLVFLIDVSGSMASADKLPLLKKTFSYLLDNLSANDRISIVTYSGEENVVLEGCVGSDKQTIQNALNQLIPSGATNGQAGLEMAYRIAKQYFIEDGNNRIIMASDGDLNVGMSSADELRNFVSEKRDAGIYLSVLGFGTGNYRDGNMEALADNGNGVYYYIDGESEAERVLGEKLFATLYTVAEDVKLQITFNEDIISEYRLIGYENRILNVEDFNNDKKDAGEVGAGHTVTVCYELKMKADRGSVDRSGTTSDGDIAPQNADEVTVGKMDKNTWFMLAVRYKAPGETQSQLREYNIGVESVVDTPSDDDVFISCVIKTCMLLHNSKYLGTTQISLSSIISELGSINFANDPYKTEFYNLLKQINKN